jgi:hypothetical protein
MRGWQMAVVESWIGLIQSLFTPTVIWILTLSSAVMAAGSLFMMPYVLCQIAPDYFNSEKPHLITRIKASPPLKCLILVLKNVLGFVLFLAGVLMIFLPGQGLLTILIGVVLMDFPGKFKIERRIVANPNVLATINWMRARRGHPEIKF